MSFVHNLAIILKLTSLSKSLVHKKLSDYFIFQGVWGRCSGCNQISKDQYQNCYPQGANSRSFHDFSSEDIERLTNVSFSSPEYTGKVLLVVNLASF